MHKPNTFMVIGNGAVGTALAARLHILKEQSAFVGRKGPVTIKSRFEGWGQVTYLDIKPLADTDVSKVALVFITVKAYDLGGALERYLPYVSKGVPIVPLCNGAIEEVLGRMSRKFQQFAWRMGLCTIGVSSVSEEIYTLRSSSGGVYWGPLPGTKMTEPTPIERMLLQKDGGALFHWQENILPAVRRKWLFNVVINSLTSVLGFEKNGELLKDMKTLAQVFDEAYRLGQELWGSWDRNHDKLLEEMVSLISATAENENSMARDVRLGKRTENDFLAKLAEGRRGYEHLPRLSQEIEKKVKRLR